MLPASIKLKTGVISFAFLNLLTSQERRCSSHRTKILNNNALFYRMVLILHVLFYNLIYLGSGLGGGGWEKKGVERQKEGRKVVERGLAVVWVNLQSIVHCDEKRLLVRIFNLTLRVCRNWNSGYWFFTVWFNGQKRKKMEK